MRRALNRAMCIGLTLLALTLSSCDKTDTGVLFPDLGEPAPSQEKDIAFLRNQVIGKGINFGNALEAPNEGEWGLVIREEYVEAIREAGFNSVRLPVAWSEHISQLPPYEIAPGFIERVTEVVDWCLARNLAVIVTMHHFNALYALPDSTLYRDMFFSTWEQVTQHFLNTDHNKLFFEPLNEPHDQLTAERWNQLIPEIIQVIRNDDAGRTLIIDGPDWAYHGALGQLSLPEDERNIIVSVRYYLPYQFTHQGAHWVQGADQWRGTRWTGTPEEQSTVVADMYSIKLWSESSKRPVTVGEFGAIQEAAHGDRVTWTKFVRQQIEGHGLSWSYFDFGVIFKAYDIEKEEWLNGFQDAFFGM